MRKYSIPVRAFLFLMILAACGAPDQAADFPLALQPEETATVFFTPTVPPASMTTAAEKTTTVLPELPLTPTYEECNQGMDFSALGDWVLCDPQADSVTVINTSNEIWQFSYKLYYGIEIPGRCTRLQHLTQDGNYLYFSLDADCILTEPGFVSSLAVFRMNLRNGGVNEVLPASYNFESNQGKSYTMSISPSGRRLAYVMEEDPPIALNIVDLQTGEKSSFRLDEKYLDGGYYHWSEDGTRLVLLLESEANYEYFISLVFLDFLEENSIVTFIHDQEYSWITSTIEITDEVVKVIPRDGKALFYDIDTGVLSPVQQ